MKLAKFRYLLATVALLWSGLALAQQSKSNIVETAAGDGSFHTMVSFIRASGMVATLQRKGPYTIFAPTDAAFAKLPVDTQKQFLENRFLLPMFLNRYIVSGRLASERVFHLPQVRTLDGQKLSIETTKAGIVLVNHGRLIKPDIVVGNGVIQGLDSVDMGLVHEFLEEVQKSKTSATRH